MFATSRPLSGGPHMHIPPGERLPGHEMNVAPPHMAVPNGQPAEHKGVCKRCRQEVTSHHRRKKGADGEYEHETNPDGKCNLSIAMQQYQVNVVPKSNTASSGHSKGSGDTMIASAPSEDRGRCCNCMQPVTTSQPRMKFANGTYAHEIGPDGRCNTSFAAPPGPQMGSPPQAPLPNQNQMHMQRQAPGSALLQPLQSNAPLDPAMPNKNQLHMQRQAPGSAPLQPLSSNAPLDPAMPNKNQLHMQRQAPGSAPLQALQPNAVPRQPVPVKGQLRAPQPNTGGESRGDCFFCRAQVTTDHERVKVADGSYAHKQCSEAQGPLPGQYRPGHAEAQGALPRQYQSGHIEAQGALPRQYQSGHTDPFVSRRVEFLDTHTAQQMNGYSFAQGIVGVRASFLTDFIQRCGGAENLQGMTCYDVNEAHVKPSTRSMAVSVTKKMYLSPEAGWRNKVGKAQTIVSFSWQYPFLMVASTVASYVKRNVASLGQDPVIWMDLFSVNQHEIDTLPPEWFQVAHPENIKEIGSVTMMFAPSHSPSTFTRAWCVLEALSALLGSVPFAIAFSAEEESRLVNTVINDHRQLKTMVENSVKPIRSATCGRVGETNKIVAQANEITRSKIFEAIEREGYEGEKLVTALLELTKDAVTSALRQIAMQEDADMAKRGNLLKALGHIHLDEGMLAASIHMLELAVQTLTDASGKERRDTLAAMATLAEAYGKMGRFSEQHFLCEQVAFGAGNAFGKFHKQTLVAKCSAAVALGNTGRLEDALREQQSILQMKQDFLGADSEEVLASMFRVHPAILPTKCFPRMLRCGGRS